MIHIGSIVAGFLSRRLERIKTVEKILADNAVFSSHRERRDLVVTGTAAVSVGGVKLPCEGLTHLHLESCRPFMMMMMVHDDDNLFSRGSRQLSVPP